MIDKTRVKWLRYCILLAAVALIWASAAGVYVSSTPSDNVSSKAVITIVDSANRSVDVPYPVKIIVVLWSNPAKEIKALGAADRIIGMDTSTKAEVDKGTLPELAGVTVVGAQESPNYEAIAQLKPDVVITLSAGYPPEPEEIQKKLEPFGIKVVGLDFYRTEVWFQEIEALGRILGKEKEAKEYADFFKSKYDLINQRIADIPQDKRKSVYFEGAKKYNTYGGAGYGSGIPNMIRASGGKDLYPERSELSFEVNPEDVVRRNPDVIFKGTSLGWDAQNRTQFKDLHDEIMSRPELANTTAVKNGAVYAISFDISGGAGKKFGPLFIAKILYPDKFQDLDPDAFYREYLEKYQGLKYQGVYLYP
ncbi:MAG: ABC transporter substrate-binding protein [Methanotrichaceae archaeon]